MKVWATIGGLLLTMSATLHAHTGTITSTPTFDASTGHLTISALAFTSGSTTSCYDVVMENSATTPSYQLELGSATPVTCGSSSVAALSAATGKLTITGLKLTSGSTSTCYNAVLSLITSSPPYKFEVTSGTSTPCAASEVTGPATGTVYSLDNCTSSFASDVPSFYRTFFRCSTITMSGGNVVIQTNSLPPHLSYYYGSSSANYTPFDTSRGSRYRANPSTLGTVAVTMTVPTTPVSRGLTITSSMVDKTAGTSQSEYSGSPQGIAIDSVQLFHGVAAPGDNIDDEAYTFDNYESHPAGTSYHYHGASKGPLEVMKSLGFTTATTPGSAQLELYGMMCDGTVVMGCTELDGSAVTKSGLDSQNGHLGTISKGSETYFTNRYHVHICSTWASPYNRAYTPEIQYYNACSVVKK